MRDKSAIETALQETGLFVVMLYQQADYTNEQHLYRQGRQLVEKTKRQLVEQYYLPENIDHILYAQCALLDETVLNLFSERRQAINRWQATPLQAHFFNTFDAGDQLYQRIRTLLGQKNADIDVLRCFYCVLLLGFQGSYRYHRAPIRQQLLTELRQRLPLLEDITLSTINNTARNKQVVLQKQLLWGYLLLMVCGVVALWQVLHYQLQQLIMEWLVKP